MPYQVLLVDDELPALRFIQSIIEKYAPDFQVIGTCPSGEQAYEYLQAHAVDVLITDIAMQRMNGVELAKLARRLQQDIHIVVISGYAEFDFAQGAIQAAVDDYILKPVGISQMKQVLSKLKAALDEEHSSHAAVILPAIACGLPFLKEDIVRYYAHQDYRFALIRWGGTDPRQQSALRATSLIFPVDKHFFALRGRDDEEQILVFPSSELERFLSDISVYMAQRSGLTTWTVIYQPTPQPVVMLHNFLKQAFPALQRQSVIGKHQILPLALSPHVPRAPLLTPAEMNQLNFFCTTGKYGNVKEYFLNLAATLETEAYPQQQVYHLVQQIVLNLAGIVPAVKANYDQMESSIADLFLYASSYGELLTGVYTVLFDDESNARDRKLSARELYDFAIRYIEENYAKPLSVQSVCDELGISQTYLSRLFRKYSDTTFNTYLMKQRMEASMALLQERPDMLLRDVAACVGYEDSSYFSKVFYQYTGKKPSQYASGQR